LTAQMGAFNHSKLGKYTFTSYYPPKPPRYWRETGPQ
jgi:hypothetical protein